MFAEKQVNNLRNFSQPKKGKRDDRLFNKVKKDKKRGSAYSNRFSVAEAYKTIRTNLQFSLSKKGCNTVIVTSTMPRDGKSTVAANISVAFAQTGSRVLLIDCDMRKPRINKFFNISATPGLSNLLVGLCSLEDTVKQTEYKNLSIITSGIIPPNPAELLNSTAMEDLIESLKSQYDLIIMDTPPINIVSDAVVVTKYAEGVVLVVRHAVTTHPDIEKSIKSFEFVNAKIIGIILNAVDYSKIHGKHYGNYSKYGRKYDSYGSYGNYAEPSEHIADLNLSPSNKENNGSCSDDTVQAEQSAQSAQAAQSAQSISLESIIAERIDRK